MNVVGTSIPDLLVIEPKVYGDDRGWFLETWQAKKYEFCPEFVQDNMSFSRKGILRGLHIQNPPQGKLVQVITGEVYDVAVDLRRNSDTFGKWYGLNLSAENKRQFWIPAGFAHGFYVLSGTVIFAYKTSEYYNPKEEKTLAWDDPTVGICWPVVGEPQLSEKDKTGLPLSAF